MLLCGHSARITLPQCLVHQKPRALVPSQPWSQSIAFHTQFPRGVFPSAPSAALVTPSRPVEASLIAQALSATASQNDGEEAGAPEGITGDDADLSRLRQEAAEALKQLSPAEMKALRAHAHRLGKDLVTQQVLPEVSPVQFLCLPVQEGALFIMPGFWHTKTVWGSLTTPQLICVSLPASQWRLFWERFLPVCLKRPLCTPPTFSDGTPPAFSRNVISVSGVQVGKWGITSTVVGALDAALEANEILKVKVSENSPAEVEEAVVELERQLSARVVGRIGRALLVYRPSVSLLQRVGGSPKRRRRRRG